MAFIHSRQRWRRQPSHPVLDEKSPLSKLITHLYVPTRRTNLVTGEVAQTIDTGISIKVRAPVNDVCEVSSTTVAKGSYFTQSATRTNLGLPWTIVARILVDSTINGVDNSLIVTSGTKGAAAGTFDRSIGVTFSSPNIFWRGALFDGTTKTVDHQTPIPYQQRACVSDVVVSASNGRLRIFVDGVACTTETVISNNGFTSYANPIYFCWGNLTNTAGYGISLLARIDGYAWGIGEAKSFHENPWQLVRQQERRIYVNTISSGGTTLSPPEAPIVITGNAPNLAFQLAPSTGSVVISGNVPSFTTLLLPTEGSVVISGSVPSFTKLLLPTEGLIAISGNTPNLQFSFGPAEGNVIISGNIPTFGSGGGSVVIFYDGVSMADGVTMHQGLSRPTLSIVSAGGGTYTVTHLSSESDMNPGILGKETYLIDGNLP